MWRSRVARFPTAGIAAPLPLLMECRCDVQGEMADRALYIALSDLFLLSTSTTPVHDVAHHRRTRLAGLMIQ
jgi:hypothetical protein